MCRLRRKRCAAASRQKAVAGKKASGRLTARSLVSRFVTRHLAHHMATPILIGVGALAAAVAGRALIRRGFLASKNAQNQWVKGGFQAKMDRKEAIAILGLKFVPGVHFHLPSRQLNA